MKNYASGKSKERFRNISKYDSELSESKNKSNNNSMLFGANEKDKSKKVNYYNSKAQSNVIVSNREEVNNLDFFKDVKTFNMEDMIRSSMKDIKNDLNKDNNLKENTSSNKENGSNNKKIVDMENIMNPNNKTTDNKDILNIINNNINYNGNIDSEKIFIRKSKAKIYKLSKCCAKGKKIKKYSNV